MGCRAPPEGDVFSASRPSPGISTHHRTPKESPKRVERAERSTGREENFRQVRRARRTWGNSPMGRGAGRGNLRGLWVMLDGGGHGLRLCARLLSLQQEFEIRRILEILRREMEQARRGVPIGPGSHGPRCCRIMRPAGALEKSVTHQDRQATLQHCGIELRKTARKGSGATPGIEEIQKFKEKRGGKDLGAGVVILEHHAVARPIENKMGRTTIARNHPGTVWYWRRLIELGHIVPQAFRGRLPNYVYVVKNCVAKLELQ